MDGLHLAGRTGGLGEFGSLEVHPKNEASDYSEGDCKEGLFHVCSWLIAALSACHVAQ
jgi:hypothetical protein